MATIRYYPPGPCFVLERIRHHLLGPAFTAVQYYCSLQQCTGLLRILRRRDQLRVTDTPGRSKCSYCKISALGEDYFVV